MNQPSTDIDALLNRAAVSFARSQRLVESWLPKTDAERQQEDEGQVQRGARHGDAAKHLPNEFLGRPERAGLGSEKLFADANGAVLKNCGVGAELESLRRQMLGRRAAARLGSNAARDRTALGRQMGATATKSSTSAKGSAPEGRRGQDTAAEGSSGDEEEGRSSAIRSRRARVPTQATRDGEGAAPTNAEETTAELVAEGTRNAVNTDNEDGSNKQPTESVKSGQREPNSTPAKRSASYLDEVLAGRASKKKKKKRQKGVQGPALASAP